MFIRVLHKTYDEPLDLTGKDFIGFAGAPRQLIHDTKWPNSGQDRTGHCGSCLNNENEKNSSQPATNVANQGSSLPMNPRQTRDKHVSLQTPNQSFALSQRRGIL